MTTTERKQLEEAKRDRHWPHGMRDEMIKHALAWIAQQSTARRNTKEYCVVQQQLLREIHRRPSSAS